MWFLIANLFLKENILGEILKLSLMKKIKNFFDVIQTECRFFFQKKNLEYTLEKNSLMLFGYFENILERRLKNISECTLEKIILKSFDCLKYFL